MSEYAVMPLRDYVDTCDTIREKTGITDVIKSGEMADQINEVYEAGRQAEYDDFWNSYQENGKKTVYGYSFAGTGWNSENFKPKYPIVLNHPGYYNISVGMFQYFDRNQRKPPLEIREGDIDFSGKIYSMSTMFSNANIAIVEMNTVPSILNNMDNTFAMIDIDHNVMHTIKIGTREETSYTTNTFRTGSLLKNVSFVEGSVIGRNISFQYCGGLTNESIRNIINTLSPTETGRTLTLNKTAVQNAFGTDYDSSTEWTTLKNSKSNWTITLS